MNNYFSILIGPLSKRNVHFLVNFLFLKIMIAI